jgi:hypothetical protein
MGVVLQLRERWTAKARRVCKHPTFRRVAALAAGSLLAASCALWPEAARTICKYAVVPFLKALVL